MDISCPLSGEPSAANTNTSVSSTNSNSNGSTKDVLYLKQLNKFSHKISKLPIRKPSFDHLNHQPLSVLEDQKQSQPSNLQQQHQPPVYNINKNDFRDVVQKLTGSPAHTPTPPPIHTHPKPQSSRLQRIRPPPLEHLTNRLNDAVQALPQNPSTNTANFYGGQRQPLSPLPPFPAVHAAAESPISAYMRYLQAGSNTNFAQPLPQNNTARSPTSIAVPSLSFPMPSSPLPLGCLPSPKSPYPSSLLFSPTNEFAFPQFPLSPTLPVPSPRWKGL